LLASLDNSFKSPKSLIDFGMKTTFHPQHTPKVKITYIKEEGKPQYKSGRFFALELA